MRNIMTNMKKTKRRHPKTRFGANQGNVDTILWVGAVVMPCSANRPAVDGPSTLPSASVRVLVVYVI